MKRPDLSLEERLFLIEQALVTLQDFGRGPNLGLCVNARLDDYDHPHWSVESTGLAREVIGRRFGNA